VKEEIRRVMKLVQEGKLSPEDAADLIDAFASGDREEAAAAEAPKSAADGATDSEPNGEATEGPPPPPPDATKDPFKSFVDFMENIGKEVSEKVDWKEVASQVRVSAQKGYEGLRTGIDQIRKGKAGFTLFGTYETREIVLPLAIPEGKTLRVENPTGDIEITAGHEKAEVYAFVRVKGANDEEARENADAFTLLVEESDHHVQIRQHDVSGLSVDLSVRLAAPAPVEIRSHAGDVKVSGSGGGCRLQSQSGDIDLGGLDGPIEITSQSGNVRVADSKTPTLTLESKSGDVSLLRVAGNCNVRTASGDVTLHECSGKTMSIESVSGDVRVDLVEPIAGTVNIRSVNGESAVAIADGSDCRVSLSTLRGEVHCDIVLEDEARMEQHVTGRLGKGTGSLDVSAVNGNIAVRLREHAASVAD